MNRRKQLAIILAILMLAPPVNAGGAGAGEIIDEGGGQFRIEVPVTTPVDSTDALRRHETMDGTDIFEESGAGIGYIAVQPDTVPEVVYVDGKRVIIEQPGKIFPLQQGRHFLSLFETRDVYLAFREEMPERFWQKIAPARSQDRFALMSSYEREAVKTGTRWVSVTVDDTVTVNLSRHEVVATYRRNATTAALTFFSVTAVIAAAMVGSVVLITRDGE